MNKEEDYRNLAGNITTFTDNTCYYEDWLVIQQYVDDWLDKIDRLNNVINELEKWLSENTEKMHNISGDDFTTVGQAVYQEVLDKLKELKENE